jgi:hypothetical protein
MALPMDGNGSFAPVLTLGTTQDVAVGAASAQSAAFGADTRVVRVISTVACRILFGANPTALATSVFLPATQAEYFQVVPGHKIAVIQASSGGTLNVTECSV